MLVDIGAIMVRTKPKADSTLRNMRKADLIDYIRVLENNHNAAVTFNENQARYEKFIDSVEVFEGYVTVALKIFPSWVSAGKSEYQPMKRSPHLTTVKWGPGMVEHYLLKPNSKKFYLQPLSGCFQYFREGYSPHAGLRFLH